MLLVTGDTHQATKARAAALRIEYFIQKPFSLKLIHELVQEIIMIHNI